MSLKLYPRPSGIYHIRGTVQGRRVDESSRTRVRAEAEAIKAQLESDLFKRAVYGERAVATFAEAAHGYMLAGGEREHLTPLIEKFGLYKLADLTQVEIDRYAGTRKVAASTLIRQIYTPLTAVMTYGSRQKLCDKPDIIKPTIKATRSDYLTPDQAEAWIEVLPKYLRALVVFILATGCRISEALELEWKDVSPDSLRVVFWETKGDYARGVDLQGRARALLPNRPADGGYVFLNSRGQPWHGYDAINLMLRRHREKEGNGGLAAAHCHLFRHTWATWAYACTRDITYVMAQGGWRSLALLGRYTHGASPVLAKSVLDRYWEFFGREVSGLKEKAPKD
jgi:integrase